MQYRRKNTQKTRLTSHRGHFKKAYGDHGSLEVKKLLNKPWKLVTGQCFKEALTELKALKERNKVLLTADDYWIVSARALNGLKRQREAFKLLEDNIKNKTTPKYLEMLGFLHHSQCNYKKALAYFLKIPLWNKKLALVEAIAFCYEKIRQPQRSIDTYKRIFHWETNEKVLFSMASRCKELKLYQEGIDLICGSPKYPGIKNWQTNPQAQIILGFLHTELHNFKLAMDLYFSDPHWKSSTPKVLGLMAIFVRTERFEEALKYWEFLSEEAKESTAALINLAHCYEGMRRMQDVVAIYTRILEREDNQKLKITLAFVHLKMGSFEKSFELLAEVTDEDFRIEKALAVASCYAAMGQYDKAMHCLDNEAETDEVLVHKLRLFMDMGQYRKALALFTTVPPARWKRKILLAGAFLHEGLGDYTEALTFFKRIANYEGDPKVLYAIASCQKKQGDIEAALHTLCSLPGWNDRPIAAVKVALIYGETCSETYIDAAIQILKNVPAWHQYKPVVLAIGELLEKKGLCSEAITHYKTHLPHWKKDGEALLAMAKNYEMQGDAINAQLFYEDAIEVNPYHEETERAFCIFALNQNLPGLENILERAIDQWPYNPNLHLLQARYYLNQKNHERAFEKITHVTQNFIYHSNGYAYLLHYYLSMRQFNAAEGLLGFCRELFQGNYKVLSYLEGIMQKKSLASVCLPDCGLEEDDLLHAKVSLPASLADILKTFKSIKGEAFIGRPTVYQLMKAPGRPLDLGLEEKAHIVFITDEDGALESISELQPTDDLNCFQGELRGLPLSCQVVPESKDNEATRKVLLGNFTIEGVYANANEDLQDLSGKGIEDFRKETLRTLVPPKGALEDDPLIALETIYWMAKGFKPTPDLKAALHQWVPSSSNNFNRDAFYALLKKQMLTLSPLDKKHYVHRLQEFKLDEKIFNYPAGTKTADLLNQLCRSKPAAPKAPEVQRPPKRKGAEVPYGQHRARSTFSYKPHQHRDKVILKNPRPRQQIPNLG